MQAVPPLSLGRLTTPERCPASPKCPFHALSAGVSIRPTITFSSKIREPSGDTLNDRIAWVAGAVAFVVAVMAIVLALQYRGQENTVNTELQQVTHQLQTVQSAEQVAARTAQQASTARLGLCWNTTTDQTTFDLQNLQLASPVISGGVYQCPSGMSFVSVVPAAGS